MSGILWHGYPVTFADLYLTQVKLKIISNLTGNPSLPLNTGYYTLMTYSSLFNIAGLEIKSENYRKYDWMCKQFVNKLEK